MIYALPRAFICFLLSVLVSTLFIRYALSGLRRAPDGSESLEPLPTAGFWMGFFETIPTFVFVIEREYTAVAILMAAKLLMGRELITGRPVHFYVGTLCNFSIAILFAMIARAWMMKFLALLII
jgi:hypothetical protein